MRQIKTMPAADVCQLADRKHHGIYELQFSQRRLPQVIFSQENATMSRAERNVAKLQNAALKLTSDGHFNIHARQGIRKLTAVPRSDTMRGIGGGP
jgi:hypothetical protein